MNNRFCAFWVAVLSLLVMLLILVQVTGVQALTVRNAFVVLENRDGRLNVRSAPVDGEVVYYLSDGRDVSVLDTANGWALVSHVGYYDEPLGWVSMKYLHIYGGENEYDIEQQAEGGAV